jgi:putative oxidoreductase
MNVEWLILIGRILWTAIFLGAGIGHLTKTKVMAGYAASKKVPFPRQTVLATGAFLVASSLMVLLGVWADLAFLLQAIYVLATAIQMHAFWKVSDPMARGMEMTNFQKNLSLVGAALALFVFFALGGGKAFDLTLTDSLFNFGL